MTEINKKQLACIFDARNNHGILQRVKASIDFKGISDYHDSRTVKALTDKAVFIEVYRNKNGYPLIVILDSKRSDIVKNIDLVGTYVSFSYKRMASNENWPKTLVIGLAIKKGELFFKYETGSYSFAPVSSITKRWNNI